MDGKDPERVVDELLPLAERPAEQRRGAVADELADPIEGDRRAAELGQGEVDGRRDVLKGIDERAIEIENEQADSSRVT